MSDLLLVVPPGGDDADLLKEVARARPSRVTVLLDDEPLGWALEDESPPAVAARKRLAALLTAIEQQTKATVVGLAGARGQLAGWRFDRVVEPGEPIAAHREPVAA